MDLTWQEIAGVAGVAAVVIYFVWWKFGADMLFSKNCREVDGTIVNWIVAAGNGVQYFYPLIAFTTDDGKHHNYRAEERSEGKPLYPIGTNVRVRYLPKDPRNVRTIYPKS